MAVIRGGARTPVGNKIAKGWTRDGNFKEVSPVKDNPGNPYKNPAKAKGTMQGTPQPKGKLGK